MSFFDPTYTTILYIDPLSVNNRDDWGNDLLRAERSETYVVKSFDVIDYGTKRLMY